MALQQIHSQTSPSLGSGDAKPAGNISHTYGEGNFAAITLKGHPVDKSKTGGIRATKYIHALNGADWCVFVSVTINCVFYLYTYLHQDIARAATISTNFAATAVLLAVLGAFIADTFLGHYFTIIVGGVIQTLGLSVLVFATTYSGLQPPACTPTIVSACPPAGGKYTATFFVAIYTSALGTGIVKASLAPFGAEQFDELDPVEKRESVHHFTWFYFFQQNGVFIAFTLTVYIMNYKSRSWGYGWLLILYPVTLLIFIAGTPKYRHKVAGGSFITRVVQVSVAAIRKRKLHLPADDASQLYDEPISGGWLNRTNKLRFLDKGSIMVEKNATASNRWNLVGTTQVEEAKRIFQLLPVWASTCGISVIFAQVVTFTATQGATLDRSIGKHFVIPPATLGVALVILTAILVPVYDKIVVPLCSKITKRSYGITPLKRVGMGAVCPAILAMISAALVERKRLGYIRDLGYTQAPFFQLPMRMWWLLPQYFFSGITELFLFVSLYEFYYHEVSDATRSIGTSFLFSALSVGYFFSSVIVDITNKVTKHQKGGAWLVERLNNGGLENYFWLLAILLSINFVVFLVASHFYNYNYSLFRSDNKDLSTEVLDTEQRQRD